MPNPIRVPDDTRSIHAIGEFIMSYQPYQNAFVNALVNRIGLTLITSKMWNNPWAVFKRGFMEFGETVEEIFVNIAKPHSFNPAVAEKEVFKREIPDVRAAFHTMNFQKFYKVTISNDQLRQAFLSWQGITDLIAKIVDSLYTGMNYDEYITMKYMVADQLLDGYVATNTYAGVANDAEQSNKNLVIAARTASNKLTFLSGDYNMAGVKNATERDEQYIIIDAATEAAIDVDVLAAAFNMERAQFLGKLIIVDSFVNHDVERLTELYGDDTALRTDFSGLSSDYGIAVVVDRDWWMVFDNFQNFTQNYNGEGLYWQYWYHTWKTFSVSPYANAVAIIPSALAGSVSSVAISPSTATVAKGGQAQFTATVTKTGIADASVNFFLASRSGTSPNYVYTPIEPGSADTNINDAGTLRVGSDETLTTIYVVAEAGDKQGVATVTVS